MLFLESFALNNRWGAESHGNNKKAPADIPLHQVVILETRVTLGYTQQ